MFEGWGSFFAEISAPVAKRVLTALGFGVVTYSGVDAMISGAVNAAKGAMAGFTGEVLQLVAMTGFFTALAISAGGLTSIGLYIAFKKLALI